MSGNDFRGDVVLQRRYAALFPRAKAEPQPASRLPQLAELVRDAPILTEEEAEERARIKRSAKAMVELERALEAEAAEAKRAQKQSAADVIANSELGRLWRSRA